MSARRTDMHRLQELVRLHRIGTGSVEVARLLRMSRNTERRYRRALDAAELLDGEAAEVPELAVLKAAVLKHLPAKKAAQQTSSVEHWLEQIEQMTSRGAGPRAIYDRLRLEHDDFDGSLSAVKRACARLKRERGVEPKDVAIPVETAPGEIAQVDFGYVGKLYDPAAGRVRKAWVFVMVLGYSRHMVAYLVFDQKVETWLALHAQAFADLGGVPRTIVPDNLKAAVVRAAFGVDGNTALNRSYRELARHYGFKVDPTPPYSPEKKGKVESAVKYIKRNFFRPRELADIAVARTELARWLAEIAGERVHGSTHRRPRHVYETEERAVMLPLPATSFEQVLWKQAKVHRDTHVLFDKRLYSVPWRFVGKTVWLRVTGETVAIYAEDVRIATHRRFGKGRRSTLESHLPEHRADLRHRSQTYWLERADALGEQVGRYIREVFEADDVLSQLRTVQAIVTHLESFPLKRARAACERAHFYGSYSYRSVRQILKSGLDLEPLPTAVACKHGALDEPRYARTPGQLLLNLEAHDEYH